MPIQVIIGIDVETTSLDPTQGEIIDVAAIKYDWETGQEIDRFEQLCKPSAAITPEISALTGITNEMVAGSPNFTEIVSRLQEFIGTDPLFAHNAEFDTKWLSYHGLNIAMNNIFDSYLLATVAYPEAPSYNLGMLSAQLGIQVESEHRAAADVELTWKLLSELRGNLTVSSEVHEHISQVLAAQQAEYYLQLFTVAEPQRATQPQQAGTSSSPGESSSSLKDIFAEAGVLSRHIPGYKPRKGQFDMTKKVAECFSEGKVAFIEAGTGTGKTFAYMVPACLAAAQGKQVIISTYTKHLQDQLVRSDIPTVLDALRMQLKVAVVKGRSNYICERRLRALVRRISQKSVGTAFSLAESFLVIKILRWIDQGGSGDIERINLSHYNDRVTRQIHADSLVCRLQCKAGSSTCPYIRSKQAQLGAQIMVVNHALLSQGAVSNTDSLQGALLVVDEAHHLEAAARQATELDFSAEHVSEIADSFIAVAQEADAAMSDHIIKEAEALVSEYKEWLLGAAALVLANPRSSQLLLTPVVRNGSAWQKLASDAATWRGRLKFIVGLIRSLEHSDSKDIQAAARESLRSGERLGLEFENFVEGSTARIQWISAYQNPAGVVRTYLNDVALSVEVVFEQLFGAAYGAVLTSATLTTNNSFAYIKRRTGLASAEELVVETPFDYRTNMLIYLVDDGPLPSDTEFEKYLYKALLSLTELLRGRILALFTSQTAVASMYQKLVRPLYKAKIKVYAQKITGGRHNMLDKFRRNPESILMGTLSFWEGIDVPGESLSCVVIPKLSFPSPDDPQLTAIADYEKVNAFTDLFVPQMILRLRQGVGRLLRTDSDRGVVVIFDPRLHRHQYGDEVLKSLPPATVHIGSGSDLIPKIFDWFGAEKIASWKLPKSGG